MLEILANYGVTPPPRHVDVTPFNADSSRRDARVNGSTAVFGGWEFNKFRFGAENESKWVNIHDTQKIRKLEGAVVLIHVCPNPMSCI